jgi:hypothetical protein
MPRLAAISDATSLQTLIQREIERASNFIDEEIGPDRAESLRYYRGDPLGNEEDGRSQVVWRVVRDSVRQILPSLVRVFFGSEKAVEYAPVGPEDTEQAEQATDYANYVVLQDNPGVKIFLDVFNDSLYQKAGIVKLWRDHAVEVGYHDFTGLDDASVGMVLQEPGTEVVKSSSTFLDEQSAGQMIAMGFEPPLKHDITVKRTRKAPRIRVAAVPPEEFLIDPLARSIESATYVGHKMEMTVGELVALGYDRDLVESHAHQHEDFATKNEAARERMYSVTSMPAETLNPDSMKVLYCESWLRVDLDGPMGDDGFPEGDGIAELRKFCTIGEGYEIVNGDGLGEPVSEIPFADFCPFPEPHLFFGEDVADQTKDLQRITSNVIRNMLDSLARTIHPDTAVVEGMVNMNDVLNTENGRVVRQSAPGMYQVYAHEFVGAQAMPVLELLKSEADRRVGVHNMALEADALQSTTKSAVNAQVDAARQQLELIARIYAECGMKRFYQLLLKLIVSHPDRQRMVRLRNRWVQIDPSVWNANMDVLVNVGLGRGNDEQRLMALQSGMQGQLTMIQTYGPQNPWVTPQQVAASMAKMYEIAGWKDTSQFVNPSAPVPPPPPPQPTDTEILAEVEKQKAQGHALETAAKIELDRDKLIADTLLQAVELQGKYPGLTVDIAAIQAAFNRDQMTESAAEGKAEPKPEPVAV